MITANEVRLGNYLLNFKNEVEQIVHLDTFGWIEEDWNPIPLTKDWLIEISEQNEFLLVDNSGFVIFKNSYAYQFIFTDYPFIHQLQNLYFALTNEELNHAI